MHNVDSNGVAIPALGFGTLRMSGADVLRMVPAALGAGFRHIDTAQIYRNEAAVGEAISGSGPARDDIFLTTKVWIDNFRRDGFLARRREPGEAPDRSCRSPAALAHGTVPLAEQIGALNEVRSAGKACHIGVSNYDIALMKDAILLSDAPLVTNQVEYHPFLDQRRVLETLREAGIALTAYYAMADGKVFENAVLAEIARRRGRSIAQILLRWLAQQDGVVALSKTVSEDRLRDNAAILDFELDPADMAAISALTPVSGRQLSPEGLSPRWDVRSGAGASFSESTPAPA